MKKFIVVFLLFTSAAFAAPIAETPLALRTADIDVLAAQYPYLKKDRDRSAVFMSKNPNVKKFTVHMATVKDMWSKREFLIIQEQGSFACATQHCPLRVFDVTNGKLKQVMNKVALPVIHTAQCPDRFSLVLTGSGNLFQRWALGEKGFKLQDTYQTLQEAKACR